MNAHENHSNVSRKEEEMLSILREISLRQGSLLLPSTAQIV